MPIHATPGVKGPCECCKTPTATHARCALLSPVIVVCNAWTDYWVEVSSDLASQSTETEFDLCVISIKHMCLRVELGWNSCGGQKRLRVGRKCGEDFLSQCCVPEHTVVV